jgi:hypothetical protein
MLYVFSHEADARDEESGKRDANVSACLIFFISKKIKIWNG